MSLFGLALGGIQRRVMYVGSIVLAVLVAAFVIWRHGRAAGMAQFAVKRAEARVRVLKKAAEVRRDVEAKGDAGVSRRLSRWMRDEHDGGV
jgi:ABC-type nickel/cobalt efflux system permease component RcnA